MKILLLIQKFAVVTLAVVGVHIAASAYNLGRGGVAPDANVATIPVMSTYLTVAKHVNHAPATTAAPVANSILVASSCGKHGAAIVVPVAG